MHRDRIMSFGVYLAGILAALVFVASKSEWAMTRFASATTGVGDLYDLARVEHFRETLPPPDLTPSPWRVRDPNDATVLVFGDSFMEASFGHPTFVDQLADALEVPVWFGGRFPHEAIPRKLTRLDRDRVVLVQSVDRFIDLDFNRPLPPEPTPGAAPVQARWFSTAMTLRGRYFRNTELNYRQFLRNFPLSRDLTTGFADVRYRVLGEITDKTPVQRPDPPMLFFYQNVEAGSFYKGHAYQHTDQDIAAIAQHLVDLDQRLRDNYRARVVFMGVPNKYVLYGKSEQSYDQFLPRLYTELAERGLPRVEVYETFKQHPDRLYWASDTHWNARGAALAVDCTVEVLRSLLPPLSR